MKIALISEAASEVLHVWTVDQGQTEVPIRYTLPDGTQISPVKPGWSNGEYSALSVTEFVIPEGKVMTGSPLYTFMEGEVIETCEITDFRPMVLKSVVQSRIIDAGKMGDAYALLTAHPDKFARWFAPDHTRVYCDDPDSIAFLQALSLDPEIFLAPENS